MIIGILSFAQNSNYGGILQSYALQTALERMGLEIVVFNKRLTKEKLSLYKAIPHYVVRFIKKYFLGKKNVIVFNEEYVYKWRKANTLYTAVFVRDHIHNKFIDSLSEIKDEFDAIVVGSDQVWRKDYFLGAWGEKNIANAYLAFTDGWNIKRIAYAASLGKDEIDYTDKELNDCKKAIQQFNAVSVREESGVGLCMKYFDVDALWVIDPTMLLTPDDYLALAKDKEARFTGDYLLKYALDESKEIYNLTKELEKEKGLTLKELKTHEKIDIKEIDDCTRRPVEEWLYAFANASYVLTDSFHGAVFSILFHKQFTVIANKDRGLTRFTSLLKMFGLSSRLIYSPKDYKPLPDIDYSKVDKIIEVKRREAYDFLKTALSK